MVESDKGFRCKADREKDAEMDKHYHTIGIKSIQAASKFVRSGEVQPQQTNEHAAKYFD